jgi:hypothetical protein
LAVGTDLPDRATVEIQVKTANEMPYKTSWPLGGVTQHVDASGHEWFVFVLLPRPAAAPPRAFVVPRDHVSAATWVVQRGTGYSQHRLEVVILEGYEDRWDLLGAPTSTVPVLLPAWIRGRAQEDGGLPPGHPWNDRLPDW